MVFMPPRHGKSEMLTVRYPVYRLEQNPETRIIVGAYNSSFASKFGRKSRRIAERRITLASDRTAVDDWETPEGGGYRSIGVGSGITGQGGHLILIDDPVKNRAEAESETYRNRVWDWYTDDLWTRQEPGCAIVLIMTRWHEDDLAGRLLAEMESGEGETWEVVNLPALAEENDPLGRNPGEALCPERYDEEALGRAQKVLGTYSFGALYQQHPTPREGAFFKVSQLQYVDAAPVGLRLVRAWDLAATEDDGDYTAGVKMGVDREGRYFVLNIAWGQWSTDHRDREIRSTAELDGREVPILGPQDPGSAGVDTAKAFVRKLAGWTAKTHKVSGDKSVRADPFSSQVNAGNVTLVRGAWNKAFVEELRAFPGGAHDDQVDAAADAFNELAVPMELQTDDELYAEFWGNR
jgi:predicted phage terminase large subunit-like protein